MTISVNCPQCGAAYQFTDDVAGQQGQCTCGTLFTIPPATVVQQPIAPAPLDPLAVQPTAPPAPLDPLAVQPTAPPAPVIQPIVPQQPIAGGQQPFIQTVAPQAVGGYAQAGGGSSTLLFVGHQLMMWSRIGVAAGLLFVMIGLLIAMGATSYDTAQTAKTFYDIGWYVWAPAAITSLVGFAFMFTLPKSTRCWGLTLAAFITIAIGTLLMLVNWVFLERPQEVLTLLGFLTYFGGGVMTCVWLAALAGHYQRPEVRGCTIAGLATYGSLAGLYLLFYILVKAGAQIAANPSSAKALATIVIIIYFLSWIASAGMEMLALGKLKRHFN